MRERDGADYVISLGGRISSSLLDLIPAYCNVRIRFVDNSTMHSDTCSFHRAFLDFGRLHYLALMHSCLHMTAFWQSMAFGVFDWMGFELNSTCCTI